MSILRETAGFDPARYLINIGTSDNQNLYLENSWRMQWFLNYCAALNVRAGIDDSNVRMVGEGPNACWVATANIYMNGKCVAKSAAAKPMIDPLTQTLDTSAAQTACTFARGRALSNAGFGTSSALPAPETPLQDQYFRMTPSFDPRPMMIDLARPEDTGPRWYLEVKWRIPWFLSYCRDHEINGYLDDSSVALVGTAPYQFWVATANVIMNNNAVAKATASMPLANDQGQIDVNAVQTACTHAMGRALELAGFSHISVLQNEAQGTSLGYLTEEDGHGYMDFAYSDSGVAMNSYPNYNAPPDWQMLPQMQSCDPVFQAPQPEMNAIPEPPVYSAPEPPVSRPQPASRPQPSSFEQPVAPMPQNAVSRLSYEDARSTVFPSGVNAKYAGRTMGDIALSDPKYIKYIVSHPGKYTRNPQILAAAEVLAAALT